MYTQLLNGDWEFRRTFSIDPELKAQEQIDLVCAGLDTLAEVTLNGHFLAYQRICFANSVGTSRNT
jgi:beta-galactosidase/beta-glucuronidase